MLNTITNITAVNFKINTDSHKLYTGDIIKSTNMELFLLPYIIFVRTRLLHGIHPA